MSSRHVEQVTHWCNAKNYQYSTCVLLAMSISSATEMPSGHSSPITNENHSNVRKICCAACYFIKKNTFEALL